MGLAIHGIPDFRSAVIRLRTAITPSTTSRRPDAQQTSSLLALAFGLNFFYGKAHAGRSLYKCDAWRIRFMGKACQTWWFVYEKSSSIEFYCEVKNCGSEFFLS